ncbi:MAG: hypothetical protein ACOCRK_06435 [bacterium]
MSNQYNYIDTGTEDNMACKIVGELGEYYLIQWECGSRVWRKKKKVIQRNNRNNIINEEE